MLKNGRTIFLDNKSEKGIIIFHKFHGQKFLHPHYRLSMIQPQQLGQFEVLDVTTINGKSNDDKLDPSNAVSMIRPSRRVWVENWITRTKEERNDDTTKNILSSSLNETAINVTESSTNFQRTFIDFMYAWELQRDVLLKGHLQRIQKSKKNIWTEKDGLSPSVLFSSFVSTDDSNDFYFGNNDCIHRRNQILSSGKDTILILEHKPVFTLGTASDEKFLLRQQQQPHKESSSSTLSVSNLRPNVIRMDRGGEVTYHGPGQLTVYPVLDLRANYKADIHWYIRALEEAVLIMLNKYCFSNIGSTKINNDGTYTFTKPIAYREPNITGVWVQNKKVAAVGIKCRQWITQHGVAINIDPSCLQYFQDIVPCGLVGRSVGCVNEFLPQNQQISMSEASMYMEYALEEVLQIQLIGYKSSACFPSSNNENDISSTNLPDLDMLRQLLEMSE